jgi:hypothetical protein
VRVCVCACVCVCVCVCVRACARVRAASHPPTRTSESEERDPDEPPQHVQSPARADTTQLIAKVREHRANVVTVACARGDGAKESWVEKSVDRHSQDLGMPHSSVTWVRPSVAVEKHKHVKCRFGSLRVPGVECV